MRAAYVISFVTTLLSVVALMAPTAYHRLRWRERNKERMLRAANLSTLAGMTLLAVAMTAAVFLVIDSVVNATWALVLTGFAAAAFAGVWLALPLSAPYDRWDDDVHRATRRTAGEARAPPGRARSTTRARRPGRIAASRSGSMLPPETMQTTRPSPP